MVAALEVACLGEEIVSALVSGKLGAASVAQVEAHLSSCERCQQVIGGVVRSYTRSGLTVPAPLTPLTSESWYRSTFRADIPSSGAAVGRVPLSVGSTLAQRFRIERFIARGGMGSVYEAIDTQLDSRVAVKALMRLDAAGLYRLKNEFRALADVRHPNLVELHELFADDEAWYFSMELIEGVRFDTWTRSGTAEIGASSRAFDEHKLRSAFSQLVNAVSSIHSAGKLHRDLKPSNVLVCADGRVVVLDFGLIAAAQHGDIGQTLSEQGISGTPAYMAPEQAAGSLATIASDYYSVGVMLFEALTGRLPITGSPVEILLAKQQDDVLTPSRLAGAIVPSDLDNICAGLLSRDPAPRVEAFASLAFACADRAGTKPLSQGESSPPTRTVLYGRQREMSLLQAAFEASCSGHKPVIVLLSGESGIGKSALVEEFLHDLRDRAQALVFASRCFERESVPFKGFDALVDELSRYLRKLGVTQVNALLPRDAAALSSLFPVLGRVDAFGAAPERTFGDPQEYRRRAFTAFRELLARIRDRQPLVVHLDDVQWSDNDSTQLLVQVLRHADAPRLLLIMSHRSEQLQSHSCLRPLYDHLSQDNRLDVRPMQLGPLPDDAVSKLVDLQELTPEVANSARGNPLLLLKLAAYLRTHSSERLPALTLSELILGRSAALEPTERRILELLAVAARPISLSLVAMASDGGASTRTAFQRLRREQWARTTGEADLVECFHDMVREAIIRTLPAAAVRDLHLAIAAALLKTADADPEQIAGHLVAAGDAVRAAEHFACAAKRAVRELGFDRGARLFALALELGFSESAERHQLQIELGNVLSYAGRGVEAADAFVRARAGATEAEATELLQRAAEQCLLAGDLSRGFALLSEALAAQGIRVPASATATIASVVYYSTRLSWRGYQRAASVPTDITTKRRIEALLRAANAIMRVEAIRGVELAERCAYLALREGDERDASRALNALAVGTVLLGKESEEVDRVLGAAERTAERSKHPAAGVGWLYARGFARLCGRQCDPDGALKDFERCIDVLGQVVSVGASYNRGWCEWLRAYALMAAGQFRAAAEQNAASLLAARDRNDLCLVPLMSGRVAVLSAIAADDVTRAERDLQTAHEIWSERGASLQNMELLCGDWLLHTYAGRPREAWICAEDWHRRVRQSPMRMSQWFLPDAELARGLMCVAWAQACPSAVERQRLLHCAEKMYRRSGFYILQSAIACAMGNSARAIAALRASQSARTQSGEALGHWYPIHKRAAQRRLGQLLGNTEGRELIARADDFFFQCGVKNPEAMVAALLPGIK